MEPDARPRLESGEEEWAIGLMVQTPYGWGQIREVRSSGRLTVRLEWRATAYIRVRDVSAR
jgi:hypothetical protein